MKVYQSSIFRRYPGASGAVRERRRYLGFGYSLLFLGLAGLFFSAWLVVVGELSSPEPHKPSIAETFLFMAGLILSVGAILLIKAGYHSTKEIEEAVHRLSVRLVIPQDRLYEMSVISIKITGEKMLVARAKRDQIVDNMLYDSLLEFELVPKDRRWVVQEAKRLMTQKV